MFFASGGITRCSWRSNKMLVICGVCSLAFVTNGVVVCSASPVHPSAARCGNWLIEFLCAQATVLALEVHSVAVAGRGHPRSRLALSCSWRRRDRAAVTFPLFTSFARFDVLPEASLVQWALATVRRHCRMRHHFPVTLDARCSRSLWQFLHIPFAVLMSSIQVYLVRFTMKA